MATSHYAISERRGEHTSEEIVQEHDLTRQTMAHIKAFFSGLSICQTARVLNTENPVRDAVLPKCKQAEDTYA